MSPVSGAILILLEYLDSLIAEIRKTIAAEQTKTIKKAGEASASDPAEIQQNKGEIGK